MPPPSTRYSRTVGALPPHARSAHPHRAITPGTPSRATALDHTGHDAAGLRCYGARACRGPTPDLRVEQTTEAAPVGGTGQSMDIQRCQTNRIGQNQGYLMNCAT